MQYKNIQGLEVPEIGLGTYKLHDRECSKIVRTALDLGYRHIDTAQMYKNEREIGEALSVSNVPREDIFLSTKIWHTNLDADDVLQSTEESLRQLDTPYVDLLMIHWPNNQYDLRATIESMLVLRDQGKAMNIGVSNFPLDLLKVVNDEIRAPIFCNQVEFHPFIDQLDLLDYALEKDIMVTAYSPLAQGKVTENNEMQEIAQKYDKSPAQISLRWLIEQENVVAIPKASSEEHLKENFEVFDFYLEDEDFERIDQLEKGTRLVNPSFAPDWG
ncbi:aldo/keto reductase [Fodinibius halophilus]|uniref:Aldo/keto reductase n=1 Tax=Fodinibius halophilus TaxID=1736908 RepID=A0A6M1T0W1_9BACT|nr:aldo/keto reductase [Fodinibius halophilus]NGP86835.1 aldo/keto reductase [Fodinibius halophilus]